MAPFKKITRHKAFEQHPASRPSPRTSTLTVYDSLNPFFQIQNYNLNQFIRTQTFMALQAPTLTPRGLGRLLCPGFRREDNGSRAGYDSFLLLE